MSPAAFATVAARPLEAAFDGGRLTSDGGLPWLARAEAAVGVCGALAEQLPDWRRGRVVHALPTLVRQRVFQLACGYADQDDADTLRHDPLLKAVCGRLPDSGAALASQPTLSRLENAADRHACRRAAEALFAAYLRERERGGVPARVLLDLDSTDDPAHGEQEGAAYHGYFRRHMYHPLLVFDGDTGQLLTAILRPGTVHAGRGVVTVRRAIVRALRQRWPGVQIELRADSGFALPRLYAFCERHALDYTIGLVPNARLHAAAAPLVEEVLARHAATKTKVRLFAAVAYRADSWPHERRVVAKVERLPKGLNTRFVVTTRADAPAAVYGHDVRRGATPEQDIDQLKATCFADRLSDHGFWANWLRLLFAAAAYALLLTLREWLLAAGAAPMRLATLRLTLLKVGGRVVELADRIQLHLAAGHPGARLWHLLVAQARAP
jgi:hypothetical protein